MLKTEKEIENFINKTFNRSGEGWEYIFRAVYKYMQEKSITDLEEGIFAYKEYISDYKVRGLEK